MLLKLCDRPVPIASFFAVPIFAAISTCKLSRGTVNTHSALIFILYLVLFYVVPSLAYLSLAQKAAPPSAPSPFLPATRNVRLLFRVNIAAFFYFLEAFRLLFTVGPEIVRTKLLYAIGRSWTGRIKCEAILPFNPVYMQAKILSLGLTSNTTHIGQEHYSTSTSPNPFNRHNCTSSPPINQRMPRSLKRPMLKLKGRLRYSYSFHRRITGL